MSVYICQVVIGIVFAYIVSESSAMSWNLTKTINTMLFDAFYYNNNHPMNVKEDGEGWTIEMRATGLTKEDITLEYEPENILVIKSTEEREKDTDYVRHEFWKDRFNDTKIQLPAGVNQDGITARVISGILEIRVQKDKTSSKQIMIE